MRTSGEARQARPRLHAVGSTCAIVAVCGLAPVALALAPRPDEPVVVLTLLPDAPVPKAVAASGAPILWLSSGGRVAVLNARGRDTADELRRHGAVLVLAAGPLGSCLPGFQPTPILTGPPQP